MTQSTFEWNRQTWEASTSGQCWWFTPYDAGWDGCKKYGGDIAADDELKQIVQMEQALASLKEIANQTERPPSLLGTNTGFPVAHNNRTDSQPGQPASSNNRAWMLERLDRATSPSTASVFHSAASCAARLATGS